MPLLRARYKCIHLNRDRVRRQFGEYFSLGPFPIEYRSSLLTTTHFHRDVFFIEKSHHMQTGSLFVRASAKSSRGFRSKINARSDDAWKSYMLTNIMSYIACHGRIHVG